MKKITIIFLTILFLVLGFFIFLFFTPISETTDDNSDYTWGITFSKTFSQDMGLDFRDVYTSMLEDLNPDVVRLPLYWKDIEPQEGVYLFDDYDWMISEAKKNNVKLVLAVGQKLPRWPECQIPEWTDPLSKEQKKEEIIHLIDKIVRRYGDFDNIYAWQVENEPFLHFGKCDRFNRDFLDEEIETVRLLDPSRPIMMTDSGELGTWFSATKRADIFGTSVYRIIWNKYFGYFEYPLPPNFFWFKANLLRIFYPDKPIIISELQMEPWGPKMIYETPLSEQEISMNLDQFHSNIEYAKKTGFKEIYLWGVELWYWMKEKHDQPELWEATKELINKGR